MIYFLILIILYFKIPCLPLTRPLSSSPYSTKLGIHLVKIGLFLLMIRFIVQYILLDIAVLTRLRISFLWISVFEIMGIYLIYASSFNKWIQVVLWRWCWLDVFVMDGETQYPWQKSYSMRDKHRFQKSNSKHRFRRPYSIPTIRHQSSSSIVTTGTHLSPNSTSIITSSNPPALPSTTTKISQKTIRAVSFHS